MPKPLISSSHSIRSVSPFLRARASTILAVNFTVSPFWEDHGKIETETLWRPVVSQI
jgi:hypothetical protein